MIVLGIDPGFGRLGWGVVSQKKGTQIVLGFGCIETDPKTSLESRITVIYNQISTIISKFKPTHIAIEDLFFGQNVTTALSVGEARGVIMLAAYQKKVPISFYKPVEIKMAVAGYGNADKSQIQHMVKAILKLESIPRPDDAADALAIALTHCSSLKMKGLRS